MHFEPLYGMRMRSLGFKVRPFDWLGLKLAASKPTKNDACNQVARYKRTAKRIFSDLYLGNQSLKTIMIKERKMMYESL